MISHPSGERIQQRLLRSALHRAKRQKLPFDLSIDDISIPTRCPLTDIPLVSHEKSGGQQGPRWNSPTLDRVHPDLGYIGGNVRVISSLANMLMGALIDPDILSEAAEKFSQRVHNYFDEEKLNADIDRRYRDRQPPTQFDKNMVSRNPRSGLGDNRQLHLKFD